MRVAKNTATTGGFGAPRIGRNAAKCLLCSTIIESKHQHDFVACPCGELCVDGGKAYLRRAGSPYAYLDLSECEHGKALIYDYETRKRKVPCKQCPKEGA